MQENREEPQKQSNSLTNRAITPNITWIIVDTRTHSLPTQNNETMKCLKRTASEIPITKPQPH